MSVFRRITVTLLLTALLTPLSAFTTSITSNISAPPASTAISRSAPSLVVSPVTLVSYPKVAAPTLSKAVQTRYSAMRWALSQKGKPYIWGGVGPSGFDCSGLVYKAYAHVGIALPRVTTDMLRSSKLIRISRKDARWGNLVFFGTGHVELVSSAYRWSFGAHHSGTKIGYRHYYGTPTFYKVRGT